MLKARTGGYDGRGNVPVSGPDDVESAMADIAGPAMVEEMVDFERELAVMGCLGDGESDAFPVTETVHREEILRESVAPARVSPEVRDRAHSVAMDVLDVMDGRGVFGIELFQTSEPRSGSERSSGQGPREEEILLNEIAPRPHNSGHWTIEGCHTSQFEQHLRAVLGEPLGTAEIRDPTVSANILGDVEERQDAVMDGKETVLSTERAHLHWYGKREVYELRKMGHLTMTGDDRDALLSSIRDLRDGLTFQH
jgi:5-(carboxyamino)imidazole ribonucleotide synthase